MCTLATRGRLLAVLALLLAPGVALAQPDSRTHDTGIVQFDVYDNGSLGAYSDELGASVGTGFAFNGENGLFEGEVLVGKSSSQVSGDAYEYPDVEWATVTPLSTITPPAGFDEAYGTEFEDSAALSPIGVRVTERSYSNTGDGFVVLDFDVTNTTGGTLTGIYVGVFADWDIIGDDFSDDLGGYDAGTQLLYIYDSNGAPSTQYFGVAALAGATVSGLSYDALPGDAALFTALTTIQPPPATAADRRTVVGTGPYTIGAGQTVNVKFAFVGGTSQADIIANAAAAQASVGSCDLSFSAADLSYNAATRKLTVSVTVHNGGTSPHGARLELDYNRNGGPPQGTKVLGSGTLPAGATASRTLSVSVPGAAPDGNYNLTLRLVDTGTGSDCDSYTETVAISGPRVGTSGSAFEVDRVVDLTPEASAVAGGSAVSPNPFARQTQISYEVAATADVRLAVYDVLGREVAVLVDGRQEAGAHTAVFDARGLAAGTYVYRLVVGNDVQTGRMTLVQ